MCVMGTAWSLRKNACIPLFGVPVRSTTVACSRMSGSFNMTSTPGGSLRFSHDTAGMVLLIMAVFCCRLLAGGKKAVIPRTSIAGATQSPTACKVVVMAVMPSVAWS